MKPTRLTAARLAFAIAFLAVSLALVSWDLKRSGRRYDQTVTDTLPQPQKPMKPRKVTDLDDVIAELNHMDLSPRLEKLNRELEEAMKHIEKQNLQFKMDREKFQKELQQSLAQIQVPRLREEIERSLARVDWDHLGKELEEVKRIQLDKLDDEMATLKKHLQEIRPQIEKELQDTKQQIEKAKSELGEFKNLVTDLEQAGLLKKNEPYTIQLNNGKLTINGRDVPPSVQERHKKLLSRHGKFTINKSDHDFTVDID